MWVPVCCASCSVVVVVVVVGERIHRGAAVLVLAAPCKHEHPVSNASPPKRPRLENSNLEERRKLPSGNSKQLQLLNNWVATAVEAVLPRNRSSDS